MGFFKKLFNQTRKPEGAMGRMMVKSMNSGHEKMADWGIGNLPKLNPQEIIELGCGGGRNAEALMKKYPAANVTAVDYSDISVEMAGKRNSEQIAAGRCKVLQADVSDLRLNSDSFDLATAFETIYFWPGPLKSFQEVYRVLKSGAKFLIVNECDGSNEKDQKWADIVEGMTIYSEAELTGQLKEAGFAEVEVFHNSAKHWIAFIAHKA